MNKRKFIKDSLLLGSGIILSSQSKAASKFTSFLNVEIFTLPALPYAYDALEPFIDKLTMEIHYSKHHQAYVTNLNKAIEGTNLANQPIEFILKNILKGSAAVRNNAGGHFNHTFFWNCLAPNAGGKPSGNIATALEKKFGSFDLFKEEFSKAALSRFGSGWAWLILNESKELQIISTPNQDNPLMDIAEIKGVPLLALDIWEHAYYLKYQNKRAEYIAAFWNIANWKEVENRFLLANR